jgi:hypothetical protein
VRIEVLARRIVYEAPPGDRYGHACEPRIVRLADGTILLSHRAGTRRESADGRPHFLRSRDEGHTWEDLGRPFDPPGAAGWDLRGAGMTQLASGDVLAVVIGLDKRLDRPVYNPDGEGLVPILNHFTRSHDQGRTWSRPWSLTGQPIPQTASQGLLTLPDGDVLMTFETFKEYDEPGPWRYKGGMLRSHDEGRTWGEQVISAESDFEGDEHDTMWWDPRIARLADGTLVQFYYAFRHRTSGESPVHVAWSIDDGRTWTPPAPLALQAQANYPVGFATTMAGQATYPIALPERPEATAPLIAFGQRRTGPGSMLAYYSADGGSTFDPASETVVYEHGQDSAGAADGSIGSFDYLISMDRFTFGHPCGVPLGSDRALVVWYAGGLTRTAIHAAELRLVEALPD